MSEKLYCTNFKLIFDLVKFNFELRNSSEKLKFIFPPLPSPPFFRCISCRDGDIISCRFNMHFLKVEHFFSAHVYYQVCTQNRHINCRGAYATLLFDGADKKRAESIKII